MTNEIILIGPPMTGKSTLAKAVAEASNLPRYSLDELRWGYMEEIGYDRELDGEFRQKGGFLARALYWQLFGPYVVERFLSEHSNFVADFGAGHTVYDCLESFNRVKEALSTYSNVFLILPSPDLDLSIRILNMRLSSEPVEMNFDFTAHFVRHPANYALARHIIYTEGKTVEESRDDILRLGSL